VQRWLVVVPGFVLDQNLEHGEARRREQQAPLPVRKACMNGLPVKRADLSRDIHGREVDDRLQHGNIAHSPLSQYRDQQ